MDTHKFWVCVPCIFHWFYTWKLQCKGPAFIKISSKGEEQDILTCVLLWGQGGVWRMCYYEGRGGIWRMCYYEGRGAFDIILCATFEFATCVSHCGTFWICIAPPHKYRSHAAVITFYCILSWIILLLSNISIVDFTDKYPARAAYQAAALPKVSCTIHVHVALLIMVSEPKSTCLATGSQCCRTPRKMVRTGSSTFIDAQFMWIPVLMNRSNLFLSQNWQNQPGWM